MPSWNIHTAHVQRLLEDVPAERLGIADQNSFLFGNLVPDVYVGYMVPDATRRIPYKDTHFADPGFIPAPDAGQFYRLYVDGSPANDLVLGAWCHLLCDHYYNLRTIEFIDAIGVKAGEQTRIRKQGDFDLFGRTLQIDMMPEATDRLVREAASFAQYSIEEADVRAAIAAVEAIVRRNRTDHVAGTPPYSLLTAQFFHDTYREVCSVLREALLTHAAGRDASSFGGYGPDGLPVSGSADNTGKA